MRPRSWKILRWLNQSTHSRVNWFEVVESTPWSPVADQFGLVEADDRLGHGVIEAVASGSDRGHRSVLGEPFGVTGSEVLHPTVGVVDQPLQDRPLAVPFQIACSNAFSARSVFREREACQPTIRRLKTSVTNET